LIDVKSNIILIVAGIIFTVSYVLNGILFVKLKWFFPAILTFLIVVAKVLINLMVIEINNGHYDETIGLIFNLFGLIFSSLMLAIGLAFIITKTRKIKPLQVHGILEIVFSVYFIFINLSYVIFGNSIAGSYITETVAICSFSSYVFLIVALFRISNGSYIPVNEVLDHETIDGTK